MTHAFGSLKTVRAFSTSNALEGLSFTQSPGGPLNVSGMPVFKSGTFKDSMGVQLTWEPEHLEQMVFNFNMLRDRGILPNVPVRADHRSLFGGGGTVIGYVTNLTHDQSSGRLLADYEITEPDAAEKIKRGTFRARSAEVGMYETNDEAMYWPVFMGFAWVDIPAVEGLYEKAKDNEFVILTENDKEKNVDPENPPADQPPADQPPADAPPADAPPADAPPADAPPADQPPADAPPAHAPPADAPPADAPPASGQHSAPVNGQHSFSINGVPTNDFGAVQRHITALETAATEQRDQSRRDYVAALAATNKITQPMVEHLTTSVLTMTDEQYGSFCAAYGAAPTAQLLAVHAGPGNGQPSTPEAAATAAADALQIARDTVAMHRRAGMSEEQIAKTPSFIRLQALEGQNPKE